MTKPGEKAKKPKRRTFKAQREECLRRGEHLWGEGAYAGVCLRCGEGSEKLEGKKP